MKYITAMDSLADKDYPFFFDVGSLYERLELLNDRRDPHGLRYPLALTLVFIILAKLAGEQEPRGIAQWVELRKELLKEALHFDRDTVPHPITYSRILGKAVDVAELQQAVSLFLLSAPQAGQSTEINLDGKALRGTIPSGQKQGLHLLAAYLPDEGIVLMQMEVGSKENEIVAAPRLLKSIDLKGKVVTGDAMFAQRDLSRQIIEAGGHYLWTVKDNQAGLRSDIEALFEIEEGKTSLKAMSNDWLEVMDIAHRLGLYSSATMMFGHVETPEDRIEHLDRLRTQQDISLKRVAEYTGNGIKPGHFTAFICWTFQAEHTKLKAPTVGAHEYLKTQALGRIFLDNIENIQSSWVTQGLDIGQVALKYGANDLGSIMIEENVVSQAGTTFQMTVPDMHRLIKELGYEPHQRDNWYRLVN